MVVNQQTMPMKNVSINIKNNGGFVDPETFCKSKKTPTKDEGKEYIVAFKIKVDTKIITDAGGTIEKVLEPLKAVKSVLTDKEVEALKKNDAIKYIEEEKEVHAL